MFFHEPEPVCEGSRTLLPAVPMLRRAVWCSGLSHVGDVALGSVLRATQPLEALACAWREPL